MSETLFNIGIDIGSTTIKTVIVEPGGAFIYTDYRRHLGTVNESLIKVLNEIQNQFGDLNLSICITGSAGMGVSDNYDIKFIQELIASAEYINKHYPEIKTLIDIGGEDSKIIFFDEEQGHDLRMNGSCAGGTGAYIDQMSSLLNLSLDNINSIVSESTATYSIASRCGVFAKTDVQNLLAREIPKADICASIFDSLALQIKNSLLRGKTIYPKILFTGGPLTFLSNLKQSVIRLFEIETEDIIEIANSELVPAIGSALFDLEKRTEITLNTFLSRLTNSVKQKIVTDNSIKPLFNSNEDYHSWKARKSSYKVKRIDLTELDNQTSFLGIDSGSTTTKIVLTDVFGSIAYSFYQNNLSDPIGTVKKGLLKLKDELKDKNIKTTIASSAVTGYGEDLIRSAFNLNFGVVETIAHYRAAYQFDKNVSFILDIGGQDMKAIFIKDGIIKNIEINEACSSGCGTFIETFAGSLDYTVEKFAQIACDSYSPCDLGTRCTVFMNSKVKQSFRDGSSIADISAGLAYSIINNCLHKVLKIYDNRILGDNIIVQGGTFKNDAVHRAFENISGRQAICPDVSELMGAYGAALVAKESQNEMNIPFDIRNLDTVSSYDVKYINCKGCDNYCKVSKLKFENGNFFYTGNRCENVFTNKGQKGFRGYNLVDFKLDLLFNREHSQLEKPLLRIGIPRVLNIYENYPFWHKLMTECGIEVVLSDNLSEEEHLDGSGTLMSDNICYPAKIVHTHIKNLINKKVDRIFYPFVSYEEKEFDELSNCFNCPVVSGYPDVIRSSMDPEKNHNIFFDSPNLNFDDFKLLKSNCYDYLKQFGVAKKVFSKAFDNALEEKKRFKDALKTKALEILITAEAENRKVFVLAQRPYQIDKAVNHGIPKMITDFGYDVITEDSLPYTDEDRLENINILTQWGYPNRLYKAAKWSLKYNNIEFIQLNSFGCGPDTIIIDEIKELMEEHGRNHEVLRIDEHSAPGSIKLRLRSLVESLKLQEKNPVKHTTKVPRRTTKPFTDDDKGRTIIVPFFSPFHSAYASAAFLTMGYNVEQLPKSSNESIDLGLKYVNNEICYPAILIIGDILRAIKSGKYDLKNLAVGITQTGGQCRASNYLSLIKKALVKNGYESIPVVGVSLSNQNLNYQPGFKLNVVRFVYQAAIGVFYGDAISRMFYSITPREKVKGTAKELADKYAELAQEAISKSNRTMLRKLLEKAVSEFNNVELEKEIVPRIGVVGEVYVKYNPVGNNHTIDYLLEHGVEPVMPPLIDMFSQWFPNINIKNDLKIQKRPIVRTLSNLIEKYYTKVEHEFDGIMRNFKFYITNHSIDDLANYASKVSNLGNHFFGEGWLIAGDILAFAKEGIYNVLCLQPFGCIANHVVAKGIEGKLKEVEPKLNILYLDIDSGVSPVNLHNRLYLLLKRAEKEAKEKELEVLC